MKALNVLFASASVGLLLLGGWILWAPVSTIFIGPPPNQSAIEYAVVAATMLQFVVLGSALFLAGWVGLGISLRRS